MKVGLEIDQNKALRILRDAGIPEPPRIPPNCNTVLVPFETIDGLPAVAINQTKFVPTQDDNEEQVNGLTVAVAIKGGNEESLMDWARRELGLE